LRAELIQHRGAPALLLYRRPQVAQHRGLVPPVEARVKRQLLADQATEHAADEGGGDVDEVRLCVELAQRLHQAAGAEQVGLRGQVGRIVEFNSGRRVDHDGAAAQLAARLIAETEGVPAEVHVHHRYLLGYQGSEWLLAELLPEPAKSRAGEDLTLKALARKTTRAGTDCQIDPLYTRQRPQALLHDGLAKEAGTARDEE